MEFNDPDEIPVAYIDFIVEFVKIEFMEFNDPDEINVVINVFVVTFVKFEFMEFNDPDEINVVINVFVVVFVNLEFVTFSDPDDILVEYIDFIVEFVELNKFDDKLLFIYKLVAVIFDTNNPPPSIFIPPTRIGINSFIIAFLLIFSVQYPNWNSFSDSE